MIAKRIKQLPYLLSGLTGRFGRKPNCPGCGGAVGSVLDRKLFHTLIECDDCHLMHRFPVESSGQMTAFYNQGYAEPGLTTDLPTDDALRQLLATGFVGSGKDFSHHVALLRALGVPGGTRVLDYGANWGYATWQFRQAGFDAQGFELSRPRAAFGTKLGLRIETVLENVQGPFGVAYSSHVLEHVPNPAVSIREQLALVEPGGLVIAHTPNGSRARLKEDARGYHKHWGQVHPVLLTERFVSQVAGDQPYYITCDETLESLAAWNRATQVVEDMTGAGLFFVIVKR